MMPSKLLRPKIIDYWRTFANNLKTKKLHTCTETNFKEIKIPTEWGHISGKLWGNENCRPILALHGWQDNAGTWDPLAPHLTKGCSLLAIDFPGHGLSSWFPPGMQYYAWMLPTIILTIKEYYQWKKVSLLCHSMGSIAGLRYASVFPEDVDSYIAVESLVADDYDLDAVIENYPKYIKKVFNAQKLLKSEPPAYTLEEMTNVWHLGTHKSVDIKSVPQLMKRGAKPSCKDPNKFYFSRDPRLKHILFNPEDKMFVQGIVQRVQCPTLYIKANESKYSTDSFAIQMKEFMLKNNPKSECVSVPGTHHVHLNNPEVVAPLMINFLKKYDLYKEFAISSKC